MNHVLSQIRPPDYIVIPWPRDPRQWPLPGFTHPHGHVRYHRAHGAFTRTRPRQSAVITYRILPRLQMRLDFLRTTDPTVHDGQP